jgi:hypothetical protein
MNVTVKISLPEWAHRQGLTWAQAWTKVLRREVPAEKIGRQWFVEVTDKP